jgi:HSP20 family protein
MIGFANNPMGDMHNTRLQQLHGQLGQVVYEMTRNQFGHVPSPEVWQPAINAYRCETSITVCVELAGVDKEMIDLRVEPLRLSLRGRRQPPEPCRTEQRQKQILAMEIDYGPFERHLILPIEVDTEGVTAEQRNGLLWIVLPIRSAA